jgi:hypothetical protein
MTMALGLSYDCLDDVSGDEWPYALALINNI